MNWVIISLVLLVLAIGLTPRIPVGIIEGLERIIDVRGEDIWILVLAIVWIVSFLKSRRLKLDKPPLLLPILFWLGVGFFSLLVNWAFDNVSVPRGFFYFAKELQFFFVYFFIFFHVKSLDSANLLLRTWIVIGIANIAWVFYQLFIIGRKGEYGISAFNEWGVFPTGSFFLMLFIFLFNWWLYCFWRKSAISWQKKYLYLAAVLAIIIGILGALSKTVFVGFWFALVLSIAFYVWNTRTLKVAVASFLLFVGVSAFTLGAYFSLILPYLPSADRLLFIKEDIVSEVKRARFDTSIAPQFQETIRQANQRPLFYVIGHGKGAVLFSHESHNQYLRNFVETGIAGSIAFLVLIGAILMRAWKGFKQKNGELAAGLAGGVIAATLTMLFMSLVVDAFIVVKTNMTYWFFLGLAMALLHAQKDKILQKI